jgi:folate-binding protein YgfZ
MTATPIATTVLSPLLGTAGAVPAEGADTGVAWHYGDPLREQRRLAAGEALVDLSHRGVVRVSGPDRLSWLHSLTSQHLTGLSPGDGAESLVLSPHGHIEHDLHLVDDGTATWIGVEPGTAAALVGWLDSMRFMLRVEVADLSAGWAVIGRVSDGPDGDPDGVAAAWQDPWPGSPGAAGSGTVSYTAVPDGEHPGRQRPWRELLVPTDAVPDAIAGRPLAGTWAAEALRVAAWRPRLGLETDHRTIPHELDWLRTGVHLSKGCYRGQETVARVHNLGRPPRRLVLLHLDGSEHVLPGPGAPVLLGERPVGRLTSPARHYELGPVALAVVKRSVPVDAALDAGGIAAAQEPIVGG